MTDKSLKAAEHIWDIFADVFDLDPRPRPVETANTFDALTQDVLRQTADYLDDLDLDTIP